MKVQTNVGEFFVRWQHDITLGVCTCTIINNENNEPISTGAAKQGRKEKIYVKETGRKFSLTRALQNAFTKEVRESFWKAYLNRKSVTATELV